MSNRVGEYKRVEHSTLGSHYYICPKHRLAVPVGKTACDTMQVELAARADYTSPETIAEFPCVTTKQLHTHFSDYAVIPLLKDVLVTKPLVSFSGYERDIRDRQRRVAAENERRAAAIHKIKSSEFYRGEEDLEEFM